MLKTKSQCDSLSHHDIDISNPRLSVSNNIDVLRDKLFTAISARKGEHMGKVSYCVLCTPGA